MIRFFSLILLCLGFFNSIQSSSAQALQPQKGRFISLAPSLTEWLYELGAQEQLIARSAHCDHPPQAKKKPSAGTLFPPDLELILSYQPSDILMIEGHDVLKAQLTRLGVRVHTLQPRSIDDFWQMIHTLGQLLQRSSLAQDWITRAQQILSKTRIKDRVKQKVPTVLIEVWPKPLSVAGAESFMGALVQWAGGKPIPHGLGAWPQLPLEELIVLNPDVILVSSPVRVQELLSPQAPKAWRTLTAIQKKHVFAREGRLERPGPRILDELIWLINLLQSLP